MLMPLAAACPTSDDLARRLDIPICAVPSMIAAIPVVEPSAAMSKVVSGCCALNASASCGTSFAPRVSEPLMTRRSAYPCAVSKARPRVISSDLSFIVCSCFELRLELKLHAQVSLKDAVLAQWIKTERVTHATRTQVAVRLFAIAVGEIKLDGVTDCVTGSDRESFHVDPAIEDIRVNEVRIDGKLVDMLPEGE